jgi:hypothetical protein
MRPRRTTSYLLILVSLLLAGALAWAGCGDDDSNSSAQGTLLSNAEAFVASAAPGKQTAGTETKVGDVTQLRDATISYTIEATDPRVAGTYDVIYSYDEAADGSGRMWATWKLTNNDGTWVCDAANAAFDAKGRTFVFALSKGTGAYDGLVSLWQWYWPLNTGSFSTALPLIAVSGWIQKAP